MIVNALASGPDEHAQCTNRARSSLAVGKALLALMAGQCPLTDWLTELAQITASDLALFPLAAPLHHLVSFRDSSLAHRFEQEYAGLRACHSDDLGRWQSFGRQYFGSSIPLASCADNPLGTHLWCGDERLACLLQGTAMPNLVAVLSGWLANPQLLAAQPLDARLQLLFAGCDLAIVWLGRDGAVRYCNQGIVPLALDVDSLIGKQLLNPFAALSGTNNVASVELEDGWLMALVDNKQRLPSAACIAARFELTPAEGRLCRMLVEGKSLAEVADLTSKSEATVRYQLKQVFRKTGWKRQGQLISTILLALLP